MNILDEQKHVISEYETVGLVKQVNDCYMFKVNTFCPFRVHKCTNHRYIIVDTHKIILKCYCHKCEGKFQTLWKKKVPCLFKGDTTHDDSDNDTYNEDHEEKQNNDNFAFLYKQMDEFQNDYFDMNTYKKIFYKEFEGSTNYTAIKEYVEKYYFKINNPPCFLDINGNQVNIQHILANISYKKIVKTKKGEIKEVVLQFLKKWLYDMDIKYYDTFGLYPPPLHAPSNFYNTFKIDKYWATINKKMSQPCPKMIYHFKEIICNNDPNLIKYLASYTYHLVRYPAHNPQIFLVFYSNIKGAGKNTYPYILSRLIGGIYWAEVEGDEYFNDNAFNGVEDKKVLLIINEGKAGKKSIVERLKARLTNQRKKINKKHEKEIHILNVIRYILTTNESNCVNVSNGRRWFMTEINDKMTGNVDYFNELYNEIANDNCICAFWKYILSELDQQTKLLIDTGKYNFQNERPLTQYYKDVLTRNTDNFTQFLGFSLYNLCKCETDGNGKFVKFVCDKKLYDYSATLMRTQMNDFYDTINDTDKSFKIQHKTMINKFREIKHMGEYCIEYKTIKGKHYYRVHIDNLNYYLLRNFPQFYDNIHEIMNIYSIDKW